MEYSHDSLNMFSQLIGQYDSLNDANGCPHSFVMFQLSEMNIY